MFETTIKVLGTITAIGAAGYSAHLIWKYIIMPVHRAMKAMSTFVEAQPVLLDMAREFKPNNGNSLRDQVDLLKISVHNIEGQVEKLVQLHKQDVFWDGDDRRRTH